jgi:hypothetical protein
VNLGIISSKKTSIISSCDTYYLIISVPTYESLSISMDYSLSKLPENEIYR